MKQLRQAALMRHLRAHGLTTVDDLASRAGASHATVRRDLAELEREGRLVRVHGGAQLPPDDQARDEPVPFERVATHELGPKHAIARRAARLVSDGDVLDTTLVEVPVKRAMMRCADRVVLLADHGKLPGHGTLRVCGADGIHTLVTDDKADPQVLATLAELGTEVITA